MEVKTFAIACGGTGGHLTPGIATAEELIARGHKCILIVSQKSIDKTICTHYPQIPFVQLPAVGFSWKIYTWPKFFWTLSRNFLKAFQLLRTLHVDAVIGLGGFTNTAIVLAAFLLKKPCFLHEANHVVGKAIRWLSPFATRIYLPEGVFLKSTTEKKIAHLGFPLRKEIQKLDKKACRKNLNLPLTQKLLVVLGGSQGALVFNKWVLDNFSHLAANDVNVLCVTGVGKAPQHMLEHSYQDTSTTRLIFIPFSQDISTLLSAADLVTARAGAGTIAELSQCETPSILVPYPHAAEQHQLANAIVLEQQGGCLLLEQDQMYKLLNETIHLINDTTTLHNMSVNLSKIRTDNTTKLFVNDIEKHLELR